VSDTRAVHDRFFLGMAIVMLALNLVGFAPSYFLKGFFETPDLPLRTHIHGVIFISWFVLFAVQTSLVSRRRVDLHRRLGVIGVGLIVVMVVSGLAMLYFRAQEYSESAESLVSTTRVVWGNLALLSLFTGFAALGIVQRRRPQVHRRLMLLACLSMMGQSLGRLGRFPGLWLSDSFVLNEVVYGLGGLLALLLSMCVHDMWVDRRLHRVTWMGAPILLGSIVAAALFLPNVRFARELIEWLN
jgi:uncharacterized membrane protein YozB (DUF420 family)